MIRVTKPTLLYTKFFPLPPSPFSTLLRGGGSKARLPKFLSLRLDRKSNSAHFCIFPKFWLAAILIRKQKNYQNYRIRPNSSAPLPNLANSASLYSFITIPIRFLNSASFSGFAKSFGHLAALAPSLEILRTFFGFVITTLLYSLFSPFFLSFFPLFQPKCPEF